MATMTVAELRERLQKEERQEAAAARAAATGDSKRALGVPNGAARRFCTRDGGLAA